MRNFQDTFETRKRSFISAFSIYLTVPLTSSTSRKNPTLVQKNQIFEMKIVSYNYSQVFFLIL